MVLRLEKLKIDNTATYTCILYIIYYIIIALVT